MKWVGTLVFLVLLVAVMPTGAFAVGEEDVAQRRAELEQNLAAIEAEIAKQQEFLDDKRGERVSLERDISILDAQIEKAQLSIRARDIGIEKLTEDIGNKSNTIDELDEKLIREKESLANILRKRNEIDDTTIVEFVLASRNVSEFFSDIDSFAAVKSALRESFVEIEDTKALTADEREQLEVRRTEERDLRTLQVLERNQIVERQDEREEILRVTQGEENAYQALIVSIEKTAAEIRSELFTLRDSAAIPFGEALALANRASAETGVRPALISRCVEARNQARRIFGYRYIYK